MNKEEKNKEIQSKADAYNAQAQVLQANYNKLNDQISRLKTARKKLKNKIEEYRGFGVSLSNKAQNKSMKTFEGTNRKEFEKSVGKITSKINSNINYLERNLASMDAKIATMEFQSGDMLGTLNHLLKSAKDVLESLIP
jgi:prefoldin subunit 5